MELTAPMPAPAFAACRRKLISSTSKPRQHLPIRQHLPPSAGCAGGDVIQSQLSHSCRDNPL